MARRFSQPLVPGEETVLPDAGGGSDTELEWRFACCEACFRRLRARPVRSTKSSSWTTVQRTIPSPCAEQSGAERPALGANRGFAAAVNAGVDRGRCGRRRDPQQRCRDFDPNGWNIPFAIGRSIRRVRRPERVLTATDPDMIDGTFDAVCRGGCALRCGAGRPDGPYWSTSSGPSSSRRSRPLLVRRRVFQRGRRPGRGVRIVPGRCGIRTSVCVGRIHRCVRTSGCRNASGQRDTGPLEPRTVRNIARNQVLARRAALRSRSALRRFGWPIAVLRCCGEWSRFDTAPEPLGSEANLRACACSALSEGRPSPHAVRY